MNESNALALNGCKDDIRDDIWLFHYATSEFVVVAYGVCNFLICFITYLWGK
jgi:hypothetical protein